MQESGRIDEYIESLIASKILGRQVVYQKVLPPQPASTLNLSGAGFSTTRQILKALGIKSLYSHQQQAIDAICDGKHVVVSTPTASGKTIIYNLPVIDRIVKNPQSRALYLFPLKALAQDQLRTFEEMAALSPLPKPTAAIYDGDTTPWQRKKIRNFVPHVILSNPEMLHLSFLAYHEKWKPLFENLKTVVVDEVHTYRGVMGSHMAQIFKRLRRVCERYGSRPNFVFSSATIANPADLAQTLTGLPVDSITKSGAPTGKRHFLFLNPLDGPAQAAILLLKAALHRGLRTIVYTQSRKLAELIALWAGNRSGKYADRISAYRAGFLPEQRREIESKLLTGELLAVISTSALELGIDIGDLDLCLLVGYPGTVMSTWQRGGRVGRSGHSSAIVLIAGEDALDQYFIRNPEAFFAKDPEAAVINPDNPDILKKHLICAAAELPLNRDDPCFKASIVKNLIKELEDGGLLLRSADGAVFYSAKTAPHRLVDLRGSGVRFSIILDKNSARLGEIDGFRAFRETHPGAVYLHQGRSYRVVNLDCGAQTITVKRTRPLYYTRVRGNKQTEILSVYDEKRVYGNRVCFGRLKVTDQVTGYEKWQIYGKRRINIIPLDLPPQVFETDGIWFVIPPSVLPAIERAGLHFMGGIHALEHAIIGICPLFVLTDRNDLGGISIPFHPQVGDAAVFIYDGVPGGIGLSREAFSRAGDLLSQTKEVVASCPCETGCPSCVHSPKCGSGNRPIDKAAALFIIDRLMTSPSSSKHFYSKKTTRPSNEKKAIPLRPRKRLRFGVLDIETQRSAKEVGGWHMSHKMGVSCAVLYDSLTRGFDVFYERDINGLIDRFKEVDLVVGFNIKRFDYQVLSGYSRYNFDALPTLDMLDVIYRHLGYRLSLDHLARVCLGTEKTADGLQALVWWKQKKISKIVEYCKKDVEITKDLYEFGRDRGYLLFKNKAGHTVRIPAGWD